MLRVGLIEPKGAGKPVELMAAEFQCSLLTLSFLRPTRYIRDGDRKPHKHGSNLRLRYDGFKLSYQQNWSFGEISAASTGKWGEFNACHIAKVSRMADNGQYIAHCFSLEY